MCNERENFSLTSSWAMGPRISITDLSRLLPDSNIQAVMRVWTGLCNAGYEMGEKPLPAHVIDEKAVHILQENLPFYRKAAVLCLYNQLRNLGLCENNRNLSDSAFTEPDSAEAVSAPVFSPLVM